MDDEVKLTFWRELLKLKKILLLKRRVFLQVVKAECEQLNAAIARLEGEAEEEEKEDEGNREVQQQS